MRHFTSVAGFIVALCTALPALAADLPTAKPEEVGLSSARLARITETLKADVERGRIPGAVVVIARRGRIAYAEAVGFRDKAAGVAMPIDAIFRIASMTKPMASVAAMMLYEDGRLFVNDPVSKYIPAFGKMQVGVERLDPMTGKSVLALVPAEREMTIQDLLRHTSGLTYGNRGTTMIHQAYPPSSSTSARQMTSDHLGPTVTGAGDYLPGPGYGFGLGFAVRRETGQANLTGSAGDYNWGGAYGTAFWIDPKEQLVVVSMTQAPGAIRVHYRQLLKTFVLQAIAD